MHFCDCLIERVSSLLRFHSYPPLGKAYVAIFYLAGLWGLSERYSLVGASKESIREWVHRFSMLFRPSRSCRRPVAVDETVARLMVVEHMFGPL